MEPSLGSSVMDTPTKTPPHTIRPSGLFVAASSRTGSFKLGLSYNGVDLGYVGVNDRKYCVITGSDPLEFTTYVEDQKVYLETQWDDSTYYLSISRNAYVGLYNWRNATAWKFEDGTLLSEDNQQHLSYYSTSNEYLYAWDAYSVLEVTQD